MTYEFRQMCSNIVETSWAEMDEFAGGVIKYLGDPALTRPAAAKAIVSAARDVMLELAAAERAAADKKAAKAKEGAAP